MSKTWVIAVARERLFREGDVKGKYVVDAKGRIIGRVKGLVLSQDGKDFGILVTVEKDGIVVDDNLFIRSRDIRAISDVVLLDVIVDITEVPEEKASE